MTSYSFPRWVVVSSHGADYFMLGRYYWNVAHEYPIRTFRTRDEARKAAKTCGLRKTTVKKVMVTIRLEETAMDKDEQEA